MANLCQVPVLRTLASLSVKVNNLYHLRHLLPITRPMTRQRRSWQPSEPNSKERRLKRPNLLKKLLTSRLPNRRPKPPLLRLNRSACKRSSAKRRRKRRKLDSRKSKVVRL